MAKSKKFSSTEQFDEWTEKIENELKQLRQENEKLKEKEKVAKEYLDFDEE